MGFPIKNGDVPWQNVSSPGRVSLGTAVFWTPKAVHCTAAWQPLAAVKPWKARVWPYWTNNIAPMLTGEQMRLGWVVSRARGTVPIGSMYAIYGNIYHQYTPNVSIYTIHGSYGVIPRGSSIVFPMKIGVNLGVDPPVLDRSLTFLGSPFRYLPKSSHVNPRIDKPLLVELPTRPTISISMYHNVSLFQGNPLINQHESSKV